MSALTIFTLKIFTPFKLTLWLMIGGFCQFLNQWTCAMGTNFSPTQALFMLWKLRHICMCGSSVEGPRDQAGLPWNVSPHEFHSPAAYFNSHLFHRHKRGELQILTFIQCPLFLRDVCDQVDSAQSMCPSHFFGPRLFGTHGLRAHQKEQGNMARRRKTMHCTASWWFGFVVSSVSRHFWTWRVIFFLPVQSWISNLSCHIQFQIAVNIWWQKRERILLIGAMHD